MKKTFVVILTVLLCFTFTSCKRNSAGTVASQTANEWSHGKIYGNTYISEFAGIKFTKDVDWEFIENKQFPEIEMTAKHKAVDTVEVIIQKTDETSLKKLIEDSRKKYEDLKYNVTGIQKKKLYGKEHFSFDGRLTDAPFDFRCYQRIEGDYVITINIFSTFDSIEKIESMFSELTS